MRDHSKLTAFKLADQLTYVLHKRTARKPAEEKFGLTLQMRKVAVPVVSNLWRGVLATPNRL